MVIVKEVFWLMCCSDFGVEGPHLSVFVRFQNGHEALIAQIAMPKGTTCEAQDDPKTATLAKAVAREFGYVKEGEEGAAAPIGYMAAHQSWLLFRQAHSNILSRDVHLANAVYYAVLGIEWDKEPEIFEATCEMVDDIHDETCFSIDAIVDALEDLFHLDEVDLHSIKGDPQLIREPLIKKLRKEVE